MCHTSLIYRLFAIHSEVEMPTQIQKAEEFRISKKSCCETVGNAIEMFEFAYHDKLTISLCAPGDRCITASNQLCASVF